MASLPVLVLNSGSSSIKFSLYEAGDGARTRLFEGAVDGIGTDLGKFWIKDASGKKLVDQTPALPTRAVAFQLVADALHSDDFPAPVAIGRWLPHRRTANRSQTLAMTFSANISRLRILSSSGSVSVPVSFGSGIFFRTCPARVGAFGLRT